MAHPSNSNPSSQIDQALREIEAVARGAASPRMGQKPARQRITAGRLLFWLLSFVALALLPFIVLVRTSLWLNLSMGWPPWPALVMGSLTVMALLVGYMAWGGRMLFGVWLFNQVVWKGVVVAVSIFVLYSAMYISGANVKTAEVKATWLSLDPILRVATSFVVIADDELVVTDAARTPADYAQMGLPALENSKHYPQESGYVEAIDIRTRGRSEITNNAVRLFFWLCGFNTLRHVGTADHLHISK